MCEVTECENCGREHVSLEDHEDCCYRIYVKSTFGGIMWGLLISAFFILRL